MIYNYPIVTPANTAINDLQITPIKLAYGVIHKLDVMFPPGCVGLVGLAIHTALHQVWPTNTGDFFVADGETISFRESHALLFEPWELHVKTYNLDDTYSHTVHVRIGILPPEVVAPWLQSYNERVLAAIGAE